MLHSFFQNCCWITLQVRLLAKMEGKTIFSRRLKQFDAPHILWQICATGYTCWNPLTYTAAKFGVITQHGEANLSSSQPPSPPMGLEAEWQVHSAECRLIASLLLNLITIEHAKLQFARNTYAWAPEHYPQLQFLHFVDFHGGSQI